MNVATSKKLVRLYAFPEELIGDNPVIVHAQASLPQILPQVIFRSDQDPLLKAQELYEWFQENVSVVRNNYLICTAALPALSLDRALWDKAVADLKVVLGGYVTVEGPVYVPSFGCTRSNVFNVADFYRQRLHGSVTAAVAVLTRPKDVVAETQIMKSNHMVSDTSKKEDK